MSEAAAPPDIETVTVDRVAGTWHIHQLRRGHRYSTDDQLCAVVGAQSQPDARRVLDMGAGIGSVGLMALHLLHEEATVTMIEAQELSHDLARRTVALNELQHRVTLRLGDLRDPAMLPETEHGSYDLVLGSPPYFPLGTGGVSPHPQRAACRMELRGDVFDYCRTAALALAPHSLFSLVHSGVDPRPEAALAEAGLTIRSRLDVYFRRDRPAPTIAVWIAGKGGTRVDPEPLVIRESDGPHSEAYKAILALMS